MLPWIKKGDVVVEEFVFYLYTLSLFLPPPQPPLNRTGLSRKEIRSFFDGADVTRFGDGAFSPGDMEGKCVNISNVKEIHPIKIFLLDFVVACQSWFYRMFADRVRSALSTTMIPDSMGYQYSIT